jgi:endonuclease YncB( thermonuclease family)
VSGSETIRIRLSGIDAPESKQAFGTVAKRRMSEFVFGQLVQVEWKKRDRYGRIVGKIFASQGDAGLLLIHDGLAWHYKKYEAEQSPVDRLKYGEAEKFARAHRLGVWSMPNPIAPWDFRRLPKSERQSHG